MTARTEPGTGDIWETARRAAFEVRRWPWWKRSLVECPEPGCERAVGHLADKPSTPHGYSVRTFVEWNAGETEPARAPDAVVVTAAPEDSTSLRFALIELE